MPRNLVIIGGGPAATNAVETIRQYDTDAHVTIVSNEPAHSRMALPYWLSGQIPAEQTHTGDASYFERLGVSARIEASVTRIDDKAQQVHFESGDPLAYDSLLLATGSRPLDLPIPGTDLPGVQHLWSLKDTEYALKSVAHLERPRVVMIGAGFVGLIVLNAMFKRKWDLTVVEREGQLLPRMLNQPAAEIAAQWLRDQQVGVHCDRSVQSIEAGPDGQKQVILDDGNRLPADLVIVATGVRPNTDLAAGTGIETDHGILVDHHLRTTVPNIFAAGDVAQGPVLHQDHREVHAIQPTAVDHGRVAGANMAGHSVSYRGSLSMNVLDICGLQSASFGIWQDQNAEQTVIYNPKDSIYRCLIWTEDRLTGAVFVGRANNLGMLTDVGMVKGMIQTGAPLGAWKDYLSKNPFDIRRAFVGAKIPQLLVSHQLLGAPSRARQFRYDSPETRHTPGASHQVYVKTRS